MPLPGARIAAASASASSAYAVPLGVGVQLRRFGSFMSSHTTPRPAKRRIAATAQATQRSRVAGSAGAQPAGQPGEGGLTAGFAPSRMRYGIRSRAASSLSHSSYLLQSYTPLCGSVHPQRKSIRTTREALASADMVAAEAEVKCTLMPQRRHARVGRSAPGAQHASSIIAAVGTVAVGGSGGANLLFAAPAAKATSRRRRRHGRGRII